MRRKVDILSLGFRRWEVSEMSSKLSVDCVGIGLLCIKTNVILLCSCLLAWVNVCNQVSQIWSTGSHPSKIASEQRSCHSRYWICLHIALVLFVMSVCVAYLELSFVLRLSTASEERWSLLCDLTAAYVSLLNLVLPIMFLIEWCEHYSVLFLRLSLWLHFQNVATRVTLKRQISRHSHPFCIRGGLIYT